MNDNHSLCKADYQVEGKPLGWRMQNSGCWMRMGTRMGLMCQTCRKIDILKINWIKWKVLKFVKAGLYILLTVNCQGYLELVYTLHKWKVLFAIWLAPQSRNVECIHLLVVFGEKNDSWKVNKATIWELLLKQSFASVSVNSGGYSPRRSGSVNIHRYSRPIILY